MALILVSVIREASISALELSFGNGDDSGKVQEEEKQAENLQAHHYESPKVLADGAARVKYIRESSVNMSH